MKSSYRNPKTLNQGNGCLIRFYITPSTGDAVVLVRLKCAAVTENNRLVNTDRRRLGKAFLIENCFPQKLD